MTERIMCWRGMGWRMRKEERKDGEDRRERIEFR